jgi:hypothetical protein
MRYPSLSRSEIVVKPSIFRKERNNKRIESLIEKDFQLVCQHLEKMLEDVEETFSDDLLLGEIAIASLFRNVTLARVKVDEKFIKLNHVLQKCNQKKEFKRTQKSFEKNQCSNFC